MNGAELYQQLAERHGHYCPMSTLGVRLGEAALKHLASVPVGKAQLCYQARTCAVDGIRIILEAAGRPHQMTVESLGQHCLQLRFDGDEELTLQRSAEALQLAASYRDLNAAEQQARLELLRTAAAERLIHVTEGPGD